MLVETDAPAITSGPPAAVAAQLDKLLELAFELEIDEEKLLLQLKKEGHSFFHYDMLTDVNKLLAAIEDALAFARELERM